MSAIDGSQNIKNYYIELATGRPRRRGHYGSGLEFSHLLHKLYDGTFPYTVSLAGAGTGRPFTGLLLELFRSSTLVCHELSKGLLAP